MLGEGGTVLGEGVVVTVTVMVVTVVTVVMTTVMTVVRASPWRGAPEVMRVGQGAKGSNPC